MRFEELVDHYKGRAFFATLFIWIGTVAFLEAQETWRSKQGQYGPIEPKQESEPELEIYDYAL